MRSTSGDWSLKLYPNDRSIPEQIGRYMRPRTALTRIGRSFYPETWNDADIESLAQAREGATDKEAWDRANRAERRLESMISGGELRAFGHDDEDTLHELGPDRTTTPWFKIRALQDSFLAFPDQWHTLSVDGTALEEQLAKASGKRPRKKQTFEWFPVVNEAWRFALEEQDLPRTQACLIGHLQEWYFRTVDRDSAPHEKELSRLAKVVIDHLGNRTLSKEVSSTISSSD
jgi:hypothetical protein